MLAYSITPATEPLWRHICGFAGRERDERWLVMPKAYIDDSGRIDHSPVFVLAGWAARVETWIPFSEDWQHILDIHPRIDYFKSTEALACRGQFEGFSKTRRNERVQLLCDVLDKHLPTQITCAVVLDDFEKVVKGSSLPLWLHNPYYLAFFNLITAFANNQKGFGFSEPVDFVFDDQAEKRKIRSAWDNFVDLAPDAIKPLIGIEPAFLDDRKVKPLQAADLMAGHVRVYESGVIDRDSRVPKLPIFSGAFQGIKVIIDEEFLREFLKEI